MISIPRTSETTTNCSRAPHWLFQCGHLPHFLSLLVGEETCSIGLRHPCSTAAEVAEKVLQPWMFLNKYLEATTVANCSSLKFYLATAHKNIFVIYLAYQNTMSIYVNKVDFFLLAGQILVTANQSVVSGLTKHSDWTRAIELYMLSNQNMSFELSSISIRVK